MHHPHGKCDLLKEILTSSSLGIELGILRTVFEITDFIVTKGPVLASHTLCAGVVVWIQDAPLQEVWQYILIYCRSGFIRLGRKVARATTFKT